MRYPDFFILGAPKCGTTSLYEYLRLHPSIFMSYPKEPNYYCSDVPSIKKVATREAYLGLFEAAALTAKCGEASACGLYSRVAVPRILRDQPSAKFFACVRNPFDMFISYHGQLLFDRREKVSDPEEAWRVYLAEFQTGSEQRLDLLDYGGMCAIGQQVKRLLSSVDRSRVHFVFSDDVRKDARSVYETVLAFLEVPSDGRMEFPVHNQRKAHLFPAIGEFIRNPPFPFDKMKNSARNIFVAAGREPPHLYHRYLTSRARKPVFRPEFRRELLNYFADDIRILEEVTGRDLSAWRM
jgi:hypothetical protein